MSSSPSSLPSPFAFSSRGRREQPVAAAVERFAQRWASWTTSPDDGPRACVRVQQLPCRDVAEHDRALLGDQQHRHRRVLQQSCEQTRADELEALVAQNFAERVVRVDPIANLVVRGQCKRKLVTVLVAQRLSPSNALKHRQERAQGRAHDDEQQGPVRRRSRRPRSRDDCRGADSRGPGLRDGKCNENADHCSHPRRQGNAQAGGPAAHAGLLGLR